MEQQRESGFYWVVLNGKQIIAEHKNRIDKNGDYWGRWYIIGNNVSWHESDFDEILSGPLRIPDY